jgi:hypothetical protein
MLHGCACRLCRSLDGLAAFFCTCFTVSLQLQQLQLHVMLCRSTAGTCTNVWSVQTTLRLSAAAAAVHASLQALQEAGELPHPPLAAASAVSA